jgi:hypothetical protein
MRLGRWLVCGALFGIVTAITAEGCSSSSTYPDNVCGAPTPCQPSIAPTPSQIMDCTTRIDDKACGEAYKAMRECQTYRAKCTPSGSFDQSATNTECSAEIAANDACIRNQPLDGGFDSGGCRPRTCAQANASCGTINDGCGGTLSCGTCTNGQTCGTPTPNRCGCTCDPTWCGTLTACGTTLNCPNNCVAPKTCGGGGTPNRCGCLPNGTTTKTFSSSQTNSSIGIDAGAPLAWTSPSLAHLSDNSYATATMVPGTVTQYLVSESFGITLPVGATIDGIQVTVERSATGGLSTTDQAVYLIKGTNIQTAGDNKADLVTVWGTADSSINYGGPADKWGSTWTAADITSGGFGVAFAARYTGATGSEVARVDAISVTISYSGIICN